MIHPGLCIILLICTWTLCIRMFLFVISSKHFGAVFVLVSINAQFPSAFTTISKYCKLKVLMQEGVTENNEHRVKFVFEFPFIFNETVPEMKMCSRTVFIRNIGKV